MPQAHLFLEPWQQVDLGDWREGTRVIPELVQSPTTNCIWNLLLEV